MEITGNITKQGQTAGARIQDGGNTYCLQLNCLTSKVIFEGLMESGYVYSSYPYGFTKDGKTIQDCEDVPFDSLTEEEQQDFAIPPSDSEFMSEAELKSAIPGEHKYVEFLPKADSQISTREAFLEFLLSPPGSTQIIDNPMSYLPLNYFVSDDALFTCGEYFKKNNEKYRDLIERREKLSFECYRRLVDWMLEMQALSPDFNALDFKRGYYSWGVPGIRSKALCEKEVETVETVMHSKNPLFRTGWKADPGTGKRAEADR